MRYGTLLLALLWSSYAQAGVEIRNGGDIVTCTDPVTGAVTHELLDFDEARRFEGREARLVGNDPVEMALAAVSRLVAVDPERAARYAKRISEFFDPNVTQFHPNFSLADVRDDGALGVPAHCVLEQIAIQTNDPRKRKFNISTAVWDKVDDLQRAGLILHEVVYEEFIGLGDVNSQNTRRLVSFLIDEDPRQQNRCLYIDLLRELNERLRLSVDGLTARLATLQLDADCGFRLGWLEEPATYTHNGATFALPARQNLSLNRTHPELSRLRFQSVTGLTLRGCELEVPPATAIARPHELRYHPDGSLKSLDLNTTARHGFIDLCDQGGLSMLRLVHNRSGQFLEFYPNGQLRIGEVTPGQQFAIATGQITVAAEDSVAFHRNGRVSYATIVVDPGLGKVCLMGRDGPVCKIRKLYDRAQFNFDEDGYPLGGAVP